MEEERNMKESLRIGDIVVVPNNHNVRDKEPKTGTIIFIYKDYVEVLGSDAVIYKAKTSEIYLSQ